MNNFLFLTEDVNSAAPEEEVSLEEAGLLLAECYAQSAVLDSALLKAEFTIFQESQTLNEDAAEEKKQGFFGKAKDKVVTFAKEIWAKLVKVYNSIMDKVKTLVGGFKAKKNAVLVMGKDVAEALPKLGANVQTMAKSVGDDKGVFDTAKNAFDTGYAAIAKSGGKDGKIKLKDANKIASNMTAIANGAKTANAYLSGAIKAAEAAKEDASEKLAKLRRAQGHALSVATCASKIAVMVVKNTSIATDTAADK